MEIQSINNNFYTVLSEKKVNIYLKKTLKYLTLI